MANDLSNCIPACNSCNSSKWEHSFDEWYMPNNPIYSQVRLDKINKWLNKDYKFYIESKLPYKIVKEFNKDRKSFTWYLWSMDKQCKLIEIISSRNSKKEIEEDIKKYFPDL